MITVISFSIMPARKKKSSPIPKIEMIKPPIHKSQPQHITGSYWVPSGKLTKLWKITIFNR